LVEPEFGTGCVKVTPAHDPNDEISAGVCRSSTSNKDGTLNENGAIPGQDRFVARKNVVQQLEADGVLVKVED